MEWDWACMDVEGEHVPDGEEPEIRGGELWFEAQESQLFPTKRVNVEVSRLDG